MSITPTPTTDWWRDHDNVVLTAYWMRDHGHDVDDFIVLIEKPWKFEDEYTQAREEWAAEEQVAEEIEMMHGARLEQEENAESEEQERLEQQFMAGFDEGAHAMSDKLDRSYDGGYNLGQYRRDNSDYDPRWDFADAARAGTFAEFKRGFEDGFDGKQPTP